MKIPFTKTYSENPRNLIRKCGYGEQVKRSGDPHYTRRAGAGEFPRFHVYLKELDTGFQVNLHLDQKAACYEGSNAHSGEYDGELVEKEGERIRRTIAAMAR